MLKVLHQSLQSEFKLLKFALPGTQSSLTGDQAVNALDIKIGLNNIKPQLDRVVATEVRTVANNGSG